MLDAGEKYFRAAFDDYNRRNLALIAEPTFADLDRGSQIVAGLAALPEKEKRAARRDLDQVMTRLLINFPVLKASGFYSLDTALRQMGFDNLKKAYEDLGGIDPKNYEDDESYKSWSTSPSQETKEKSQDEAEAEAKKQKESSQKEPSQDSAGGAASSGSGGNLFAPAPTTAPDTPNGPRQNDGQDSAAVAPPVPRQPFPGARTKTSLRSFARMQQGAGDRPFGFKADDLDHNFSFVHLKPADGNNSPYRIRRDNEGYALASKRAFDFCENGKHVQYEMFASVMGDEGAS
jgi:hypothetical protein